LTLTKRQGNNKKHSKSFFATKNMGNTSS